MSEVLILTIGASIFAVTTCATVMAGGIMMTRVTDRDRKANLLPPEPPIPAGPTA